MNLDGLSMIAIGLATFILLFKWVLMDFLISMTLMNAFVCCNVSRKFKQAILANSTHNEYDIGGDVEVREAYNRTKIIFNKLNQFSGPICGFMFVVTTTFCAVNTIAVLDSEGFDFPVIIGVYMSHLFLAMVYAAEAHYQASYYKVWLLTRRNRSLGHMMDYFAEAEECDLAVKGGRLLTITYSYSGTAASLILTYTIIMIQFGRVEQR